MKEWEKLEPGFESGKMAKYLQKHEPVFKELKTKMSAFFENIRDAQKKTNKYVHKQGYSSFIPHKDIPGRITAKIRSISK